MKARIGNFVARLIMLLFSLTILLPLGWIIVKSLQTNQEFFAGAWGVPKTLQWNNYVEAWENLRIGSSLLNTLIYVSFSLVFSLGFTTAAAYVLTRIKFRGRNFIRSIIMFSLFLPGVNALVPTYVILRSMGLLDKISGLILFNGLCGDAFSLMVLCSFMSSIPHDYEESAFLDGASLFQVFRKIIVPMSTPGIMTLATFKVLWYYNDFMLPYIVLQDKEKYTIGVNMYAVNELMQTRADWVTLCAGVVIAMAPPVIVYMAFQKNVISGVTVGGLKG